MRGKTKNQTWKHLREDQKGKRKIEKAGQIAKTKTDSRINKFKCIGNHNKWINHNI